MREEWNQPQEKRSELAESVKRFFSSFMFYLSERDVDHWLFFLAGFIIGAIVL